MLQSIVVFLTAISIRTGLLSSKIHNGDGTPKDHLAFIAVVNGIAGSSPAEGTEVLLLLMLCDV